MRAELAIGLPTVCLAACLSTGLDELSLACAPHCGDAGIPRDDAGLSAGDGGAPLQRDNCAPTPHLCGFPDDTNTGVKDGISLAESSGMTLNTAGAVVENRHIVGQVEVTADNVVFRNVRIDCIALYGIQIDDGVRGVTVEDSEIAAPVGRRPEDTCLHAVIGSAFTLTRVRIHHVRDGVSAGAGSTIEDSYFHDMLGTDGAGRGIVGIEANRTFRHNTIDLGAATSPAIAADADQSSQLVIERNLLTGGEYVLEIGSGTDRRISGNRFSRRFKTNGGDYGILHAASSYTWADNVWDDDGSVATP